MRKPQRRLIQFLAIGVIAIACHAQPPAAQAGAEAVVSTRFTVGLTYEAVLARLAGYYDEQLGRKLDAAFPQIGPRRHFEVWHDIWAFFELRDATTTVTLKRATAGIASRLVKGWMIDLAGRLDAPQPLEFHDEPALHEAAADIEGSRADVVRALGADSPLTPIATWVHGAMLVSPLPLTLVILSPVGPHGVHHVTVAAETTLAARQLLGKLQQGVARPGICAAYSEAAEIDSEIHDRVNAQSADGAASQALYVPNLDEKYLEGKVRNEPAMLKRAAAAQGQFTVRFRLDKSYRKVTVVWNELTAYARATGKFGAEREIGQSAILNPRPPAQGGAAQAAHTRLPPLEPGAYRIRLEGEDTGGSTARIDERTYWFDGKAFEEL